MRLDYLLKLLTFRKKKLTKTIKNQITVLEEENDYKPKRSNSNKVYQHFKN